MAAVEHAATVGAVPDASGVGFGATGAAEASAGAADAGGVDAAATGVVTDGLGAAASDPRHGCQITRTTAAMTTRTISTATSRRRR